MHYGNVIYCRFYSFLAAQITALHSGHLGISAEFLLSIKAYYKHTHTEQTRRHTPAHTHTNKLPPVDELCMGTTRDGRA